MASVARDASRAPPRTLLATTSGSSSLTNHSPTATTVGRNVMIDSQGISPIARYPT